MAQRNFKIIDEISTCLLAANASDSLLLNYVDGPKFLMDNCVSAASTLRNPLRFNPVKKNSSFIKVIRAATNNVLNSINEIENFIIRAKDSGFLPPSNPLLEITNKINKFRSFKKTQSSNKSFLTTVFFGEQFYDDLVFNLNLYLNFVEAEKGTLNKENLNNLRPSQISSYKLNLTPYKNSTGNIAVDLMSYLPNIDLIKRKRFRDSLAFLDFSKRKPEIVFTLSYEPFEKEKGVIVAWKKIIDSSGFILKRKNIFTEDVVERVFTSLSLEDVDEKIKNYIIRWVGEYYKNLDINDLNFILDEDIEKNQYYKYSLISYQNVKTKSDSVFNTEIVQMNFSSAQLKQVEKNILDKIKTSFTENNDFDVDDLSPYPFLSDIFYGTDKFDWILAAVNTKLLIELNYSSSDVRKSTYIGARFSFIKNLIEQNIFYRPESITTVQNNITESIKTFGIAQTLQDVIENLGLYMYFGAKENYGQRTFKKASATVEDIEFTSLDKILASIDPATSTVDIKNLLYNISLTFGEGESIDDVLSEPKEITVQDSNDVVADGRFQFVSNLTEEETVLDLMTFDGISKFFKIIRLFFDFNYNRRTFDEVDDDVSVVGLGGSSVQINEVDARIEQPSKKNVPGKSKIYLPDERIIEVEKGNIVKILKNRDIVRVK